MVSPGFVVSLAVLMCLGGLMGAAIVRRRPRLKRRTVGVRHTADANEAPDPPDPPLVSLVLLLRRPRAVEERHVRAAAERAFDLPFGSGPESEDFVTRFRPNMFPVRVAGAQLGVITSDAPYVGDPLSAAEKIEDARLRSAFRRHEAWISVDWFGQLHPAQLPDAYRLMSRLLAEFTGPDCVALYATERKAMLPFDANLRDRLRGDSPLSLFLQDPVVSVEAGDPRMAEAVAEARRRWPEFEAAFDRRKPEQIFSAKAPFRESGKLEFMWIHVTALEHNRVFGTLDSEPSIVKRFRIGQQVSFPLSLLNDWLYKENGTIHGGFTVAVLRDAQRREARQEDE